MSQEEVRVTSSSGGQKGKKLARFDLIPVSALTHLAEHYGKGAEKYEDRNWERGYEWSLSYAALQRHLTAWWNGEDVDAETGHSHLDAVMFHAFALRTFIETHPEFDDRPVRRSVPQQGALDYVCAQNGDVTVPDVEGCDLGTPRMHTSLSRVCVKVRGPHRASACG